MNGYDVREDDLLHRLPRTPDGLPRAGNVVIQDRLGQGGMGAVYLGRDTKLNVPVAVKVVPFHLVESNPDLVKRFQREAQAAAQVDHPNLMRVYTVDEESGVHYLVLEFVDGESAAERLNREGALPESDSLDICISVGEALAAAHAEGIIHRDIKPANIMIRHKDGRVKVADLGLAKSFHEGAPVGGGLTATGQVMGTPAYMSPEQAKDASQVDPRADVYSLGATLYALLGGRAPHEASQLLALLMKVANEEPDDLKRVRPELSDSTCELVKRMMAKKPQDRIGAMAGEKLYVNTLPSSPHTFTMESAGGDFYRNTWEMGDAPDDTEITNTEQVGRDFEFTVKFGAVGDFTFKATERQYDAADKLIGEPIPHSLDVKVLLLEIIMGKDKIIVKDRQRFVARVTPETSGTYHWDFSRPDADFTLHPNDKKSPGTWFTAPTSGGEDEVTVTFTDDEGDSGLARYPSRIQEPSCMLPPTATASTRPIPIQLHSVIIRARVLFTVGDQRSEPIRRNNIIVTEVGTGFTPYVSLINYKVGTGTGTTNAQGQVRDTFETKITATLHRQLVEQGGNPTLFVATREATARFRGESRSVRDDTITLRLDDATSVD